jgi:Villin headpiece domain
MGEDSVTGLSAQVILNYDELDDLNETMSQVTLGEQSYIMDLANQKHFRKARRKEEAMEDAMELFNVAVEEGAPETKELFILFMKSVLQELEEENREKDRLRDEWLEAALQEELDRRENPTNADLNKSQHTVESLGVSFHQPPSIYNGAKNTVMLRQQSSVRMIELDQQIHEEEIQILKKKIKKAEKLMQEIENEKGQAAAQQTRKYKMYKKKINEYRSTLKKAQKDELKVSRHSENIVYDWDAVSDGDDTSEATGNASSSSTAKEALDRAYAVLEETSDMPEKLLPKRTPHRSISFDTVLATTGEMSGHELNIKVNDDTRWTPASTKQLSTMREEEESDGDALFSTGSKAIKYSPSKSMDPPVKCRSPSWNTNGLPPVTPDPRNCANPLEMQVTVPQASVLLASTNELLNHSKAMYYTLTDFEEGRVPDSIDMDVWEDFLSTDEFEKSFGMTREAFEEMPKWKRLKAKRQLRRW